METPSVSPRTNEAILKTRVTIVFELSFSVILTHLIAALIIKYAFSVHTWPEAFDWLMHVGSSLITDVGWIYGVYTTILLALYALVFGEEIAATKRNSDSIRRRAGWTSMAITALLAPAVSMILCAAIVEPSRQGLLFALVPITGILIVLSASVSRFTAAEPDIRIRMHKRSIAASRAALKTLPRAPRAYRAKTLASIALNTVLSTLLPAVAIGLIYRTPVPLDVLITLSTMGFLLTISGMLGIFLRYTAAEKFEAVIAEFLTWVPVFLPMGIMIIIQFDQSSWEGASFMDRIAVGAMFTYTTLFFLISILLPRDNPLAWARPKIFLGLTVRTSGLSLARHVLKSTIRRSQRELRRLQTDDVKVGAPPTP